MDVNTLNNMPYHQKIQSGLIQILMMRNKQRQLDGVQLIRAKVKTNTLLLELKELVLNLLRYEYDMQLSFVDLDVTPEHNVVFDKYVLHLYQSEFILYQDAFTKRFNPESSHIRVTKRI